MTPITFLALGPTVPPPPSGQARARSHYPAGVSILPLTTSTTTATTNIKAAGAVDREYAILIFIRSPFAVLS